MSDKSSSSSSSSAGVSFAGLLTILFIALKLLGYIDWAWVWVLAPLWISAIITVVAIIAIVVVAAIISFNEK